MPMTLLELKRLYDEWRIRLRRVRDIVQPPAWSVDDWHRFAVALYVVVKRYGNHWQEETTLFWDIRWDLEGGGQLICQVEEASEPEQKSLVVAQKGGFADGYDNYTWFYAEFGQSGSFIGDPYWVDGNWKDALAMILLPQQMAAGFYLQGGGLSQQHLLLGQATGDTSSDPHP